MLLPESYFVDLYENFRLVCKQMVNSVIAKITRNK